MGIQTDATPYIKEYEKDFEWFESKLNEAEKKAYLRGIVDGTGWSVDIFGIEKTGATERITEYLKSKSGGIK